MNVGALFRSVAITCEVAAPVLNALVPPPVPTLNLVPCCPTAVVWSHAR